MIRTSNDEVYSGLGKWEWILRAAHLRHGRIYLQYLHHHSCVKGRFGEADEMLRAFQLKAWKNFLIINTWPWTDPSRSLLAFVISLNSWELISIVPSTSQFLALLVSHESIQEEDWIFNCKGKTVKAFASGKEQDRGSSHEWVVIMKAKYRTPLRVHWMHLCRTETRNTGDPPRVLVRSLSCWLLDCIN